MKEEIIHYKPVTDNLVELIDIVALPKANKFGDTLYQGVFLGNNNFDVEECLNEINDLLVSQMNPYKYIVQYCLYHQDKEYLDKIEKTKRISYK